MHSEFEVTTEDKLIQYEIVITGEASEDNYKMEIIGNTKEATYLFKKRLDTLKNGYAATDSIIPNYHIIFDATNNKTIVEGNVTNAIELLMHHMLLSKMSYDEIYRDALTKEFLAKSKEFKLPKTEIPDKVLFASYRNDKLQQEIAPVKLNKINRLKNELADEYKELSSKNLDEELKDFLNLLSQKKGRSVKFSTNDTV